MGFCVDCGITVGLSYRSLLCGKDSQATVTVTVVTAHVQSHVLVLTTPEGAVKNVGAGLGERGKSAAHAALGNTAPHEQKPSTQIVI
jgi:hypothetical protein